MGAGVIHRIERTIDIEDGDARPGQFYHRTVAGESSVDRIALTNSAMIILHKRGAAV